MEAIESSLIWWDHQGKTVTEPTTDEEARRIIRQDERTQFVYTISCEYGLSIMEAMANAISSSLDEPGPYPLVKK